MKRHTLFLNDNWKIEGVRVRARSKNGLSERLELRLSATKYPLREFAVVDARMNGYPDAKLVIGALIGTFPDDVNQIPKYIKSECERMLGIRGGRGTDAVLADLESVI